MSATIQKEEGGIWQFRISGTLKKAELDSAQVAAREEIAGNGKIKVLLMIEGFQGLEKEADWDDTMFAACCGDNIEQIAIVGNPDWEARILRLVGAGNHRSAVRFFVPRQTRKARAWLMENPDGYLSQRNNESQFDYNK